MSRPSTELWMFTQVGCAACMQFEHDVGERYARTAESRIAPLRRIEFGAPLPPDVRLTAAVQGTPTFVLLANHRETGRITGYSTDELFWMRLAALLGDS